MRKRPTLIGAIVRLSHLTVPTAAAAADRNIRDDSATISRSTGRAARTATSRNAQRPIQAPSGLRATRDG